MLLHNLTTTKAFKIDPQKKVDYWISTGFGFYSTFKHQHELCQSAVQLGITYLNGEEIHL